MKTNNVLDYTGIAPEGARAVIDNLGVLLASLQVLYANLRGFHWCIQGNAFFVLHEKTEELYEDTARKADEVGERIMQLGGVPENRPSTLAQASEIAEVAGLDGAQAITANLLDAYKVLMARERKIAEAAQEAGDEVTAAIMDDFLKGQEKTVWMLCAARA